MINKYTLFFANFRQLHFKNFLSLSRKKKKAPIVINALYYVPGLGFNENLLS